MFKRMAIWVVSLMLLCAAALPACGSSSSSSGGDATHISVWTYYNGEQLAAFEGLIRQFNETIGAKEGIVVEGLNLGSVDDLKDAVMDSVNGKVGAEPVPNMFMAYADTAYAIDQMGMLADLAPYLSEEERSLYIDGYIDEGTLGGEGVIKIFPVAKSVEIFALNKTDFEPFAQETGVTTDELATFEGLVNVAKRYWEWTDAQTPEPDDGKAFTGIDSMANYFFIGAKQLGVDIVSVDGGKAVLNFDKAALRKLWDCYYIPFVQGYYDATSRYRSDDVKTGTIISLIGSSSGATFFPTQVVDASGLEHDIEMEVLPTPQFESGEAFAVQQGAGMVVVDSSEKEVAASLRFLEWFTEPEQNIEFSLLSGYLPVTKSANSMEAIHNAEGELDSRMEQVLSVGISTVENNTLYTPPAFAHGSEFRSVLEHSMANLAASDAQIVKELIATGVSHDEACAPYLTDAHFEEWYQLTLEQLEELVG